MSYIRTIRHDHFIKKSLERSGKDPSGNKVLAIIPLLQKINMIGAALQHMPATKVGPIHKCYQYWHAIVTDTLTNIHADRIKANPEEFLISHVLDLHHFASLPLNFKSGEKIYDNKEKLDISYIFKKRPDAFKAVANQINSHTGNLPQFFKYIRYLKDLDGIDIRVFERAVITKLEACFSARMVANIPPVREPVHVKFHVEYSEVLAAVKGVPEWESHLYYLCNTQNSLLATLKPRLR